MHSICMVRLLGRDEHQEPESTGGQDRPPTDGPAYQKGRRGRSTGAFFLDLKPPSGQPPRSIRVRQEPGVALGMMHNPCIAVPNYWKRPAIWLTMNKLHRY